MQASCASGERRQVSTQDAFKSVELMAAEMFADFPFDDLMQWEQWCGGRELKFSVEISKFF